MKAEDLKTKTTDELQKLLLDQKKAQFNLRFQVSGGQLDNTSDIRKTRRSIARIKTFLNAKPVEAKAAPKKAAKKSSPKKTDEKAA
ncbi:MAG: 50S ribosomal protein L29 [Alphaproteobacteria bacterium]|nr:50S ribosomal protein L29 [Alphaproteobacteria bacterium]